MNTTTLDRNASGLEELRAKFASVTTDVKLSNLDWRALMESGAIVSLSVSRYRGTKALESVDLGLDNEEMRQVESIISLGHRLLLPSEVLNEFNSCETRARQIVREFSIKTPLGFFVPASSYSRLAAIVEESKARFYALVDRLIEQLPMHRETMYVEYDRLARQVHQRLVSAGIYPDSTFDAEFTARCMATFPDSDKLRESFAFKLSLSFVPLPYQSQTDQPEFAQASNDLVNLRRAVIEEQRQARQPIVNEFLTTIQSEVYTLVNTALTDVLASVKQNGNLQSRSIVQLKNLVEKLNDLNFWSDKRLETIQAEIVTLLGSDGTKRDTGLSTAILEELQAQARLVLIQIDKSSANDVTIVDLAPTVTLPAKPSAPSVTLPVSKPKLSFGNAANGKLF